MIVKYSIALAFSLGGIAAAVRFRNTLDDSKDAVYVFLATGVGIAAAVDLPVALLILLLFNALIVARWMTDFWAHASGARRQGGGAPIAARPSTGAHRHLRRPDRQYGTTVFEYPVFPKKSKGPDELLALLRASGPNLYDAEPP